MASAYIVADLYLFDGGTVPFQSIGSRELERSSTHRDPSRGDAVISML